MHKFIILENRKSQEKNSYYFDNNIETIICHNPHQLEECFGRIEKLRKDGCFLVGFISYEACYSLILNDYHSSHTNSFPLLYFSAFKQRLELYQHEVDLLLNDLKSNDVISPSIRDINLNFNQDEYVNHIAKVKNYIYEGHTYQVNYTGKYHFKFEGCPIKYYQLLRNRQKVEYSALLQFDDFQILSLSPELFFSKTQNKLTTRPMKGTVPRSLDEAIDQENKQFLISDSKSRAENLIIVDLLRNDMNVISTPGSVKVKSLFDIEAYETVYQMTSTIESEIERNLSFKNIIEGLFPCGSITGAPKKRTIQIIKELEPDPRLIYTGTIGYITPDNDMVFNVAIRTVLLRNGVGELGVGGGITIDSEASSEFEEVKLKAKFLTEAF
ncbi:MAG: aminodeoxychorismate synthase component I [Burkholderiales bacterium]|nr:aminodeoxychorismate synthase component I [Burkholderiales bacterium]